MPPRAQPQPANDVSRWGTTPADEADLLRILWETQQAGEPMTYGDLAAEMGVTVAKIFDLVVALIDRGDVAPTADLAWAPTVIRPPERGTALWPMRSGA